jgi:hypothetical protein
MSVKEVTEQEAEFAGPAAVVGQQTGINVMK